MEDANDTTEINSIPLGLFNYTQTHLFLFSMVLMLFLISLMGNALMIVLIHEDPRPQQHTPKYFLLSQLSLMDMMLVSTIVHQMATNYLMGTRSISPAVCGARILLFPMLGEGECFLLAAMAYDRYVAIRHPLRYPILINQKLCLHVTTGSWLPGGVDGLMQPGATLSFPYCHSREINHFFCEAPTLTHLPCAHATFFKFFTYVCCLLLLLIPLALLLASYSLILAAGLRMWSTATQKKVFVTCSFHLAVVGVFCGTLLLIYVRPKSYRSVAHDKVVSASYTIFTPVLNPLIYSVRNKDVKGALRKCL
ncbi:olfactory receptor 2T8-like, partial [Neomonachus schauinslandi]|uniref:Olfactory receptor n=1 Tax=Neomonachus schauinslandi TaxID=29088 RepID=A0A8M1M382_NEOSC